MSARPIVLRFAGGALPPGTEGFWSASFWTANFWSANFWVVAE